MTTYQRNSDLMNDAYDAMEKKRDDIRTRRKGIEAYAHNLLAEARAMKAVEDQMTASLEEMDRQAEARKAAMAAAQHNDAYGGLVN